MSDGFLTLYVSTADGTRITDWVMGTGARLTASGTDGRVAVLDLEGDRHLVDRDEFLRLLSEVVTVTFQSWFSGSDDMIVTTRRHCAGENAGEGFTSVTCYLDGLEPDDVDAVIRAAQEVLESPSAMSVRGLVVDRRGKTADVDWDAFFAGPGAAVPAVPDLLVLGHPLSASAADRGGRWTVDSPVAGFSTLAESAS
ncbi:hypothetical protein LEP48_11995 [Isoptericola sp. NEAU-Y5]|uniref:Uncharacterized protein n=1 Tax=Isoptericola luteus TaxID=2879484 RepID=A0ABS7ZJP7_9MICO|nr:hypothetical protein [Isoptericola sp. NEAU-Y5]MCA5894064.1 hypothetical protein [Isoptericola sp. NEAU-Y5]